MFRKNKTTAKAASGNDLNTLLDVFDKIISGEISQTGEAPADAALLRIRQSLRSSIRLLRLIRDLIIILL